MKPNGYYTWSAYMGYVHWQFESEEDYLNYLKERGEI